MKRNLSAAVLGSLAAWAVRLLRSTWRVRLVGPEPPSDDTPNIFGFWHGEHAGLLAHPRVRPVAVLVSPSRDGALLQRVLANLGFHTVRGSSSRGAAAGLKGIVSYLRDAPVVSDAAFALDGPRGPYRVAKPGAVAAARLAGGRVIPIAVRTNSAWTFAGAWDRFVLPKPFAVVALVRGTPLDPTSADPGEITTSLDWALD